MKRISKGAAPPKLRSFPERHPGAGYDDLNREPGLKDEIHEALLTEQGWICCYCNGRVEGDSSHIEHFVPQSIAPARAVDYGNMLASCLEPMHCGIAKGARFDAALTISPLDHDCETSFLYAADGQVLAADGPRKGAAGDTIDLLKLNCAKLQGLREGAVRGAATDGLESLPRADLRKLLRAYRAKNAEGKYIPFCSAVCCLIEWLLRPH